MVRIMSLFVLMEYNPAPPISLWILSISYIQLNFNLFYPPLFCLGNLRLWEALQSVGESPMPICCVHKSGTLFSLKTLCQGSCQPRYTWQLCSLKSYKQLYSPSSAFCSVSHKQFSILRKCNGYRQGIGNILWIQTLAQPLTSLCFCAHYLSLISHL